MLYEVVDKMGDASAKVFKCSYNYKSTKLAFKLSWHISVILEGIKSNYAENKSVKDKNSR